MSHRKERREKMLVVTISFSIYLASVVTAESFYIAAVYEHKVILNPNSSKPVSRHDALQHMKKNLDIYEEQAALAAQKGAQILVFPEDGIYGFTFNRSSIAGYLETIPDPQRESWNPCTEPERYNRTEVLQRLSCMARHNNIYMVANMADLQPCPMNTSSSSSCPPDGHWQFNTNVAFRSDGLLIARYHKQNLYMEKYFDTPPKLEIITFDTPFAGKFGLFTCFDILFHDPAVVLVEMGVRQMIFPTAWKNSLPLLDSVQFQRAFSLGADVTLLAANLRNDQNRMTGSGIYTPFFATYYQAWEAEPEEGRLLVARVPVLEPLEENKNTTKEETSRGQPTSPVATDSRPCQQDSCDELPPPSYPTFTSKMDHDTFTFVLLNETEGNVRVCNGTFCCHLQYRWLLQDHKELYALGTYAGKHNGSKTYAEQVCAVVRCAGLNQTSCGKFVKEAKSKMDFLLEGNFDTKYVYPSILTSRMFLEQPESLERATDWRVTMKHSNMKRGLVTACLFGRIYKKDN